MSSTLVATAQSTATKDVRHPILVLALLAAGNAWLGAAVQNGIDSGDLGHAVVTASLTLVLYGVIAIPFLCFALLPAVVLTMALLRWIDPSSRRARFGVGAAAWGGWGLVIWLATLAAPFESRSPSAPVLLVFLAGAVQGGFYSIAAFDRPWRVPGRVLVATALAVIIFVVGGALVTALRPFITASL